MLRTAARVIRDCDLPGPAPNDRWGESDVNRALGPHRQAASACRGLVIISANCNADVAYWSAAGIFDRDLLRTGSYPQLVRSERQRSGRNAYRLGCGGKSENQN